MSTAKDMLFTAAMIALIMLAIVGVFYSTMDRPMNGGPFATVSDGN